MDEKKTKGVEALLKAAIVRMDAITQLLIDKDILTQDELRVKMRQKKAEYDALTGDKVFACRPDAESLAFSTDSDGYQKLPEKMRLMEGQLTIADSDSAAEICGSCIMQNTADIPMMGVLDVCGLPSMFRKKTRIAGRKDLDGVNPACWMLYIAESVIDALEKQFFNPDETAFIMARTVVEIETAVKQNISPDGIKNIINCAVFADRVREKEADSLLSVDLDRIAEREKEKEMAMEPDDIRWNG